MSQKLLSLRNFYHEILPGTVSFAWERLFSFHAALAILSLHLLGGLTETMQWLQLFSDATTSMS